ncbi:hypothetical protein CSB45_05045 [candidate division KSB3 bacterium]|uniref:CheW-like domain-containing protein n=1 Tax=candidate division KSB3 bacterium TaxID=2044937 RepID=A0A2G6E7H2_9BACT|nr:MAG: hypothetical protein CSB45_05045 [candidate division KSB3 bacterium]PIE30421.1 MAG: hypothetical protein CSA57_03810 [candidate division KSB3 bacterium]
MADVGMIKFQISNIHFGIFSDQIVEITRLGDVRTIPHPLPYVVGLAALRNDLVTIVDFEKRLGLSPLPHKRGTTMIAVRLSFGIIGLLVQSLSNFVRIPKEKILPPFSVAGLPDHVLQGVLGVDEDILLIPDFDNILSSYVPLRLSSITPSEKTAFHYRSIPGAIGRTLENTLSTQGYLDEDTILKLPCSMSLPSIQVHKFISYYPDFQPRTKTLARQNSPAGPQQPATKAGDESYSSLFKRLERLQQQVYTRSSVPKSLSGVSFNKSYKMYQAFEEFSRLSQPDEQAPQSSQRLVSERELGRYLSRTLRVAPVQLSKYVSFHSPSSATGAEYPSPRRFFARLRRERRRTEQRLDINQRVNELVRQPRGSLTDLLQQLAQEGASIGKKTLCRIAKYYHVSQMTIARLAGNFPELQFDLTGQEKEIFHPAESKNTSCVQVLDNAEGKQPALDLERYRDLKPYMLRFRADTANLNACLRYLAERAMLDDNRAIRYTAFQLRTATCLLNKLRTYYQFSER